MSQAFLLVSHHEDAGAWRRELLALVPDTDFRVWPDSADPADISGEPFAGFPNLRCIVFLGHGAGDLLDHPAMPEGVDIVRLQDPGLIGAMVEYVVLHVPRDLRMERLYRRQ